MRTRPYDLVDSMNRNLSIIFLIATLLVRFSSSCFAVDSGSEDALTEQKEILRAVIPLIFVEKKEAHLCNGTLVAENILLTAKHCYHPNELTVLQIQGNYAIIKAAAFSQDLDIAILLVRSRALIDLPILPMAQGAENDFSNIGLMASYALTSDQKSIQLSAAYTHYFKSTQMPSKSYIHHWFSNYSLKLFDAKDPRYSNSWGARSTVSYALLSPKGGITNFSLPNLTNQPSLHAGDSGSPIIGFDRKNRPQVVGVTAVGSTSSYSRITYTTHSISRDALFSPHSLSTPAQIVFKNDQDVPSKKVEEKLIQIYAQLEEKHYTSSTGETLVPFILRTAKETPVLNGYTSLFYEPTQKSVRKAIQMLEDISDTTTSVHTKLFPF